MGTDTEPSARKHRAIASSVPGSAARALPKDIVLATAVAIHPYDWRVSIALTSLARTRRSHA